MKIVGITYWTGQAEVVLKNDSCLLNNSKPMFMPDTTNDLRACSCIILRVSRLGKGIAPKFASRYYDAVAFGIDFVAMDLLDSARANGRSWTEAYGFDYSLAIGEWIKCDEIGISDIEKAIGELVMPIDEAVSIVSRNMTIRQGDLIYITVKQLPQSVEREQVLTTQIGEKELLFCRIK